MANYNYIPPTKPSSKLFDVAKWFLRKEVMNQRKLQKLCYYAQAWHYALLGTPFFEGEFEAWVHGPVSRELWNCFRDQGYWDIQPEDLDIVEVGLSQDDISFLEDVWATYGKYNSYQLEKLSHSEKPWIIAREGIENNMPSKNIISPREMADYYYSLRQGDGIGE